MGRAVLLQEVEQHRYQPRGLIFAPKREKQDSIGEGLPLRQMKADALRDGRLADAWDAQYCREPVLEYASDYFLHLSLPAYKLGDLGDFKRIGRLLLDQLMLTLLEGSQDAALVLLLFQWLLSDGHSQRVTD